MINCGQYAELFEAADIDLDIPAEPTEYDLAELGWPTASVRRAFRRS